MVPSILGFIVIYIGSLVLYSHILPRIEMPISERWPPGERIWWPRKYGVFPVRSAYLLGNVVMSIDGKSGWMTCQGRVWYCLEALIPHPQALPFAWRLSRKSIFNPNPSSFSSDDFFFVLYVKLFKKLLHFFRFIPKTHLVIWSSHSVIN